MTVSTLTVKTNILTPSGSNFKGWELLGTQTVTSSVSSVDVINLTSTYFAYKFIWSGFAAVSSGQTLRMRTSADNGGSWDSGGSDYGYSVHLIEHDTTPFHDVFGDNLKSFMDMGSPGDLTNELYDTEITLYNPSATEFTKFTYKSSYIDSVPNATHLMGSGIRLSAAAINGVAFSMTSGNIDGGTLKIYGCIA